ncbi:MAG: aminotransferase class V-fold PLP-dependent enzyme [Myxococcota bacterium]|nr:aminotransferase class V-fold PLP-dependent enzyme [Myxococcota bacterium]
MQRFGAHLRSHFLLDDRLCFLNHGSFGACPKSVLDAQTAWRSEMERDPIRFLVRSLPELLRSQAAELASFLGARGDDIAFVENATTGVNAVLRSLDFQAGDEILVLSHVYPAVNNTVVALAQRYGCRVVRAELPVPLRTPEQVVEVVEANLSPRTRVAVLDHITSFSGAVLPVTDLVAACHGNGTPVLVDGAHAPGMLDLDLESIGADYYVGNCHKWLWAPKGCAFLHVKESRQLGLKPTVISLRQAEGFPHSFDWTGTKDPSAYLALRAGLEFHAWLGPEAVRAYNHDLVVAGTESLASALGWELPVAAEMTGSIRALRIPGTEEATRDDANALHDYLADVHHIEALVQPYDGLWLRASAQVYNERGDFAALLAALQSWQGHQSG